MTKTILVKKLLIQIAFLILWLLSFSQVALSQKITQADLKKLRAKEDTLSEYSEYLNTDSLPEDRMIADSAFTKVLVRALQVKNSFYYPFDSVLGVSKLYATDTSFRIITWNINFDDYYSRQKGAIQFRTTDGSLKLLPLRDVSEFTDKPQDSVRSRQNWIGSIYYNIIKTQHKGKNYYTLFGFDNNSAQSSMKWIEVLSFNEKNEPVFGGPFFSFEKDSVPKPPKYRLGLEFKKGARVLVNYIEDLGMILVDHLISESDQPELAWTYVPDGDQEGFKWENGKWMHIDKVFTLKLEDGQAPVGDPLMDPKGNKNEQKLQEKTDKNKAKEGKRIPLNYDN
ncbi:MAG TPA: hypothetical protein PLO70_12505 [Chitinophagaceae bacterium]|jgi:hypothetical protein|nr:hypothetical protein [Chitinophagaceae bacterium]HQZ75332.1 hypothetical protein [Chitinophagaceae bacterium]